MIQKDYIRDLHNNYMVIKGVEGSTSGYKVRILLNNTIKGILNTELRYIDKMDLFYYDITGQLTLRATLEKSSINYTELKKLLESILMVIEQSEEFLLSEDDFVIDPDYIYFNPDKNTYNLCYIAEYKQDLKIQLGSLVEFLLNKIDYKDEDAVVLIYALYREIKETNCCYDKLKQLLHASSKKQVKKIRTELSFESEEINKEGSYKEGYNKERNNKERNNKERNTNKEENNKEEINKWINNKETTKVAANKKRNSTGKSFAYPTLTKLKNIITKNKVHDSDGSNDSDGIIHSDSIIHSDGSKGFKIPFIEEIKNEREIYYYNSKIYILAGLFITIGIISFILAVKFKLLHNVFGNRVDIVKMLSFIIILSLAEVYLLIKLFDKKNRGTKIVTEVEYIEAEEYKSSDFIRNTKEEATELLWVQDEEDDKTQLLYMIPTNEIISFELHNLENNTITLINTFPFTIGKAVNKVNLYINDSSISRFHAKITVENKDAYITDLGSTNGTFINGIKLLDNKPCLISPEDEIRFSNKSFVLR